MSAVPATFPASGGASLGAARAGDDAVRRLLGEHALLIMTGRLSTGDVVTAVEDSWRDLNLAGAPAACLPEFVERLARVRLTEIMVASGDAVAGSARTDATADGAECPPEGPELRTPV